MSIEPVPAVALTVKSCNSLVSTPPITPAKVTSPHPDVIVKLFGVLAAEELIVLAVVLKVTLPSFPVELVSIVMLSAKNTLPVNITSPLAELLTPPGDTVSPVSLIVVIFPLSVIPSACPAEMATSLI